MTDDSPQIDRFDDHSLGDFVVGGPRSLLLETEREVWWESDFSIRRFHPPSLLESLIVYRLPNYFDEMELPAFLGRDCRWNRSVEKKQRIPIEDFTLQVRANQFAMTLSEVDSLKRDLQAVVRFVVAESEPESATRRGVVAGTFWRAELGLRNWTTVRAGWRNDDAVMEQICWEAVSTELRGASNRPPPPVVTCERFETDPFSSFIDVAVNDLCRIHQLL